jgi:ubiquinone/menaquinone biosynthesis C-methylase UbiE
MSEKFTTADVRRTWEAAAPGWARWEARLSAELSDATERLIDMAAVRPGMRVLDVACGAGAQSLRLAERVGPDGSVLATDISATMLEQVRANAARAGLGNVETRESAAEELDETPGPFDASICRLGLMLFPSPRKALEAIRRVLKPGARFAALVFTTPDKNPFMAQPMKVLLQHAGKEPPPPGQPGIFALGREGLLQELVQDTGFEGVQSEILQARLRLPNADEAFEMMREAFGAYHAVVADLGPEERARAWEEVHACLKQFETAGQFEAPLEFVIASGARPS